MEVREKIPRLGNMLSICLFLKHMSLSMLMKKMSVVCQKLRTFHRFEKYNTFGYVSFLPSISPSYVVAGIYFS